MISPRAFIAKAREFLNTPFRHQGRRRNAGVDCIGLVICVAQELRIDMLAMLRAAGFDKNDFARYARDGQKELFARALAAVSDPDPAARAGSILVFDIPNARAPHVAIKTDRGMLHAYDVIGRVTEHRIDEHWRAVTASAWRLRGVA